MAVTPAVWFRINNGEWNGNPAADPASQEGGFDLSSITGPYLPFISGSTGFDGNCSAIANFGAGAFNFTPPAGAVPIGAGYTWNPADASPATLFSDGNLNAGVGGENETWVRATGGTTGGLQYYELTLPAFFNAEEFFLGVANAAATISTGGSIGAGANTLSWNFAGQFVLDVNTVVGTADIPAASDVIGVALFTQGTPPPTPTPTPAVVIPQGLGLWRGQVGINWQGLALVGDAFTGVVGLSDFNVFSEYGNQMRMLVTSPPIHKDRKRISIPRFEIEVEAGLGTPGQPEVPPLMMLDYSKDGGITWVPLQMFRSMGAAGEYIKRLRWINLGNARTWVFRLQYTSMARPTIIGSYLDMFVNLG